MGLIRFCARECCAVEFMPKRPWQRYCTAKCQNSDKVGRHRHKNAVTSKLGVSRARKCSYRAPAPFPAPLNAPSTSSWSWARQGDPPLKGDDYPLEYFADGYPKLPPCLDR